MAAVHTIPAHVPFLEALAAELVRRPVDVLADTLVLLPSRRACLALRDELARAAGERTLLLPRLQPVGEIEPDELLIDPAAELALPASLPPLRRHLLLTRLVLAKDRGITHEQAVRLAGELMRFLDEVATENVPLAGLDGLVKGELDEHWQQTLEFLQLITQVWPEVVAEQGFIDPVERRNRLLAAWAARWRREPPHHPVIAAGITGSIPKVAELLGVVARLPQSCIVLPGLDCDGEEDDWGHVGADHPQHCLKRLLERIGIERAAVECWPHRGVPGSSPERAHLLAEVMRPAATSDGWQRLAQPPSKALQGLEIVTAPDLASEAVQLALRVRAALETPGKRVALVTSDRNLARRVAVELQRWDVRADDSAGIPLDQSPPGSFLLLTAHCIVGDGDPIHLLATLKHPLASGGTNQGEFRRKVRALERALLRGPRRAGGLKGLVTSLRAWPNDRTWRAPVAADDLADWLDELLRRAELLCALLAHPRAKLAEMLEAHLAFAEWLASDEEGSPSELWAKAAGIGPHRFVSELREAAGTLGEVPTDAYPALLAVMMGRQTVRPQAPAHPRVSILGQLESRLQQVDLVLIAGLNEGVWPRYAESGPWLSRPMRGEFGLPPAELQVGIAAHDLFMAACAPEVVFSRARKDEGGAPPIPSRWLARLDAVLRSTGALPIVQPRQPWQDWAMALDQPEGRPEPCKRPEPRPPRRARPRDLTVTEVEMLVRDPYAVYAKKVLDLRPLEGIDADPGLPERGQIIHDVLEQFVNLHADSRDPVAALRELGRRHFKDKGYDQASEVFTLWWPRFEAVAIWFCGQHRQRQGEIARLRTELEGSLSVAAGSGSYRIRTRADRVEVRRDGSLAILDYKTGTLPSGAEVRAGLRPQLVLEALIAAGGGFPGIPAIVPAELLYWGLKGSENAPGEVRDPLGKASVGELIIRAREWLHQLMAHFADPSTAYIPVPRPEIAPVHGDYEPLARVPGGARPGGGP